MSLVSYAQNFEDVMLWRALGHLQHGFFIDVGAAWPVQDSVTRLFKDRGWTGINVEPNPELFRQLVDDRPDDTNLAVAVADKTTSMELEVVVETGLSTLDHEIGGTYRRSGRTVTTVTVDVVTLAELWSANVPSGQEVHFLKVDVEGFEAQVLSGGDWERHRPWIVVVEATRPTSQDETHDSWEPSLVASRYTYVYADGLNRFYVANEHDELVDSFRHPPNVFDSFTVASQDVAERRAAASEVQCIEERHRADVTADSLARSEAEVAWAKSEWDAARARLEEALTSSASLHHRIGGLEALLTEREQTLASLEAQLKSAHHLAAQSDRQVEELRNEALLLRNEALLLRGETDRLGSVIGALEAHIGDMYASTSWRFARPVRLVSRVLRRLRRLPRSGSVQRAPAIAAYPEAPLALETIKSHEPHRDIDVPDDRSASLHFDLPEAALDVLAQLSGDVKDLPHRRHQ